MQSLTCCFTGHRGLPREKIPAIRAQTMRAAQTLIKQGVTRFVCGGAVGYDTLAAEVVLELRKRYSGVKLILMLPCRDQAARWRAGDRARYEAILREADEVQILSECYSPGCMHKRNRAMVDASAYCICFLQKETGGTAYTVGYAAHMGLQIYRISVESV